MRARYLNEKFTEDSDAIHDMGIGEAEYQNLVNAYKDLDEYMNFDVEDLDFTKVIETLNYLRRISAYNVAMFFNTKYNFYIKINSNNVMGGYFAEGNLGDSPYKLKFSTSGPGKMVGIAFFNKKTDTIVNNGTRTRSPGMPYARQVPNEVKGSGRSIHALDGRFRYYCKLLNIDIKQFEK